MKKFSLALKRKVLVIEMPEETRFKKYVEYLVTHDTEHLFLLPKGKWKCLGSPDDLKEEDVAKVVHQSIHTDLFAHYVKDIPVNTYCYKTALESFNSALSSEIYWQNPLQSTPPTDDLTFYDNKEDREINFKKWHEAQEKTFDRNRIQIFIEN